MYSISRFFVMQDVISDATYHTRYSSYHDIHILIWLENRKVKDLKDDFRQDRLSILDSFKLISRTFRNSFASKPVHPMQRRSICINSSYLPLLGFSYKTHKLLAVYFAHRKRSLYAGRNCIYVISYENFFSIFNCRRRFCSTDTRSGFLSYI